MTGSQMESLCHVLCTAFDQNELEQMLRYQFDKNLFELVRPASLWNVAYQLIDLAIREGWEWDLVEAAGKRRPQNPHVRNFLSENPRPSSRNTECSGIRVSTSEGPRSEVARPAGDQGDDEHGFCPSAVLKSMERDVRDHFWSRQNPLTNSYHQGVSNQNCFRFFGERVKTTEIPIHPLGKPWEPERLWLGLPDQGSMNTLRSHQPIRITVHAMMVASVAALVDMGSIDGIQIHLECPSSTSPRHLLSLRGEDRPCDAIITADAGVYTGGTNIANTFERVLTLWEEVHIALAPNNYTEIKQVVVVPGTTQEIHFKFAANEGDLPQEKEELTDIENLFFRARELSTDQAILLTYPKAQRLIRELRFSALSWETRGMTFGLYMNRELLPECRDAFVRLFVYCYNRCQRRFFDRRTGWNYRRWMLSEMSNVPGLVLNYAIGTYSPALERYRG